VIKRSIDAEEKEGKGFTIIEPESCELIFTLTEISIIGVKRAVVC